MISELTVSRIKRDLPRFPDEVIRSWLLPFAQSEGWPPLLNERWHRLLAERPLSFYQSLAWRKQSVSLSGANLDARSHRAVAGLIDANVHGVRNIYAQQISDTRVRFNRICAYLRTHRALPGAPVLTTEGFLYTVVDGNHRIAAYLHLEHQLGLLGGPECWLGQPGGAGAA